MLDGSRLRCGYPLDKPEMVRYACKMPLNSMRLGESVFGMETW